MAVFILNTPILTDYGTYRFRKVGVKEALDALSDGFTSAVGHQGTAELLSAILGIPVSMNRTVVKMAAGDIAVVFRVLTRLEEGMVLDSKALNAIPYELGLLRKTE